MTYKLKTKAVIAESLRNWRKKADLTHKEIADYLGITEAMYKSYEYASAEPSVYILKKLANLYKLKSIEKLIDFSLILTG